MKLSPRCLFKYVPGVLSAFALLFACHLPAQHMDIEGQTGGFITPSAYVLYTQEGSLFSHPAVSYHLVSASKVIGNVHTVSLTEGIANRAEIGYTRSIHTTGDSPLFSALWHYNGMNIFSGKVVTLQERGKWIPTISAGGAIRTSDRFVSGALNKELYGTTKSYTNGEVYLVASKMRLKPPVPIMLNFGWKVTNASISGLGGQATRFGGRFFGGVGFPLPGPWHTAIVPGVGITQEPPQVKNLGAILVGGKAHLPSTLDYAIRVTQKTAPHFSFDIGIGQVAGQIGTTYVAGSGFVPVNLQARHILGLGLSIRY
jgi:hypothetical protein